MGSEMCIRDRHPDVQSAIRKVVKTARAAGVYPGIGLADDVEVFMQWVNYGIQWAQVGVDWWHLARAIDTSVARLREHIETAGNP